MANQSGGGILFQYWESYLVDVNGLALADRFPDVKQWDLEMPNTDQNLDILRLKALVDDTWITADVSFSQSYLASEESRRTIGRHLIENMARVLQEREG